MLRLSKTLYAAAAALALLTASPALAQNGLGQRLDAKEQQLTQDEQNCREVNLAEYAQLLQEASENWVRAQKAKKKGVPVNQAQVDADLAKAMQLFARAQAAQARQCMMQAQQQQQAQPQAQLKSAGAAHGKQPGTAAGGGGSAGVCPSGPPPKPAPTPASEEKQSPQLPGVGQIEHEGELLENAIKEGRVSEAEYLRQGFDESAARLRKLIKDAKGAGEFSTIDVQEAEKQLRHIDAWRKWAAEKLGPPCPPPEPKKPADQAMNLPSWARDMLAAHNAARAAVGAPPLQWNPELQAHATARAGEIAQLRQLTHAPREGRGTERENILSAPVGYSPERMMRVWTDESRHFVPGLFPNVSDTGNWADVAHYTQMIWPQTTDIGCGFAEGGGFDWLVCRYNPGGNKDGKPVLADTAVKAPELPNHDVFTASAAPPKTPQGEPSYGFRCRPIVFDEAVREYEYARRAHDQLAMQAARSKMAVVIQYERQELADAREAGEMAQFSAKNLEEGLTWMAGVYEGYTGEKPPGASTDGSAADAQPGMTQQPVLPAGETFTPSETTCSAELL